MYYIYTKLTRKKKTEILNKKKKTKKLCSLFHLRNKTNYLILFTLLSS